QNAVIGGFTIERGSRARLIDRPRGDVILLGIKDPSRLRINVDCLVTALRAAYTGRTPVCSLDPHPNPLLQQAVIAGIPWKGRFPEIMIEADYVMKAITQGICDPQISGLRSWLDLMTQAQGENPTPRFQQVNRWWFNRPKKDVSRTVILDGDI